MSLQLLNYVVAHLLDSKTLKIDAKLLIIIRNLRFLLLVSIQKSGYYNFLSFPFSFSFDPNEGLKLLIKCLVLFLIFSFIGK